MKSVLFKGSIGEIPEIEKYVPASFGGGKMLFVLFSVVFMAFLAAQALLALKVSAWIVWTGCALGLFPAVATILQCVTEQGAVKTWRDYRQRNIKGYSVAIFLENGLVHAEIVRARKWMTRPNDSCEISIPLGGWFRRKPKILKGFEVLENWKIAGYQGDDWVKLGRSGQTMWLPVQTALELLNDETFFLNGLRTFITITLEEKNASQEARVHMTSQAEKAYDIIVDTCEAIQNTSRFGQSKDAKRIREEAAKRLLELLPKDDSRRKLLEKHIPEEIAS